MDDDKLNLEANELARKKVSKDPRTDKEMTDSYEINNKWIVMGSEDE